jgi:hypothetical protein
MVFAALAADRSHAPCIKASFIPTQPMTLCRKVAIAWSRSAWSGLEPKA